MPPLTILLTCLGGGFFTFSNSADDSSSLSFVFVGRYGTSHFSYVARGARMTYEVDEFEVVRPIRGNLPVKWVTVFPPDSSPSYPRNLQKGEVYTFRLTPSDKSRDELRCAAEFDFTSVQIGPGELREITRLKNR